MKAEPEQRFCSGRRTIQPEFGTNTRTPIGKKRQESGVDPTMSIKKSSETLGTRTKETLQPLFKMKIGQPTSSTTTIYTPRNPTIPILSIIQSTSVALSKPLSNEPDMSKIYKIPSLISHNSLRIGNSITIINQLPRITI